MRLSAGGHEKELCRGFRAKREIFFLDHQQNFFKTQNPGGGAEQDAKKKKNQKKGARQRRFKKTPIGSFHAQQGTITKSRREKWFGTELGVNLSQKKSKYSMQEFAQIFDSKNTNRPAGRGLTQNRERKETLAESCCACVHYVALKKKQKQTETNRNFRNLDGHTHIQTPPLPPPHLPLHTEE